MTSFHNKMIIETFSTFCRDTRFKQQMNEWGINYKSSQQHHVPDIWGFRGWWMRLINSVNSNIYKQKQKKTFIGKVVSYYPEIFYAAESILDKIRKRINNDDDEYIYEDGIRKKLKKVVSYVKYGSVKFHKSSEPGWFGATCNHFVSKEFLQKFSNKLEEYQIYDVLELPFSGTALEIIWGLIPGWLGFDKWFFNGIHRVRENFVSYRREDNQEGMVRYLNRYYQGRVNVGYKGPHIKLNKMNKKYSKLKACLNNYYFK